MGNEKKMTNLSRTERYGEDLLTEEAERAFQAYGKRRPRRWLSKYGGLSSVSHYRKECQALIKPRVCGNDDYMPPGIINFDS